MTSFNDLIERAQSLPQRIVLPESQDSRVLTASVQLAQQGVADIVLLGTAAEIEQQAYQMALDLRGLDIVDPLEQREQLAQILFQLRQHKGLSLEQAYERVADPLVTACLMVQKGQADGCVAGAQYATADVVRSALQIIGKHPDHAMVSSFFLMLFEAPYHSHRGTMLFADCGLVIDPDAEQLAHIAAATIDSAERLLGMVPRVAMLSFATQGSAKHPMVDKVVVATERARQLRPAADIIGEVQLDAAMVPEILAQKAPHIGRAEPSNVLIFPNLEAGNIGYKLVQRFASADAIGPILQGLKKPVNDLSRGCSAQDIYRAAVITSVQAQHT